MTMQTPSWQRKLLPFLIVTICVLFIFYMVFYFIETNDIQRSLEKAPEYHETPTAITLTSNEVKWQNLYSLEKFSINNRYYHARLIIRSRILIISLSFLTGITLSFIGAIFILAKYSEDSTQLGAGTSKINVKLASSSPGIILSFLGIVLIAISIVTKVNLNVVDSPIYLYGVGDDISSQTAPVILKSDFQKPRNIDPNKKKKVDSLMQLLMKK